MPLVKGNTVVADEFTHLADDAELPSSGAVLVSSERFLNDPEAALSRGGKTGVIWPNNRDIDELLPYLGRLAVIALVFPIFRDGRAYSQARLLRERHTFKGELRATGQVLRDQFLFMLRAGFDAFEVKKEKDAQVFAEVAHRFSVFYQPTGDGRVTAFHRRLMHLPEGVRS
ncbi:oxidoreductase [Bradyrhizobiaceae bacterium SG-6C]|nr:oxidoreductase [Bradyrhizobiaceae bacterium SG-6C]